MAEVKKEKYAETEEIKVEYPSNSNKSKINELGIEGEKSASKKIVSGKVIEKKSVSKEVSNSFINAGQYVLQDILIPAIKNTLSDIVQNTLDIILFGEARGGSRQRNNRTYVSYSSISDDRDRSSRVYSYKNKIIDDIILESRADAEDVIDNLREYIDKYGSTTIADLYDLIGKHSDYTDNDYGWKDLSRAHGRPVREGYLLELPNPICLK